MKNKVEVHVGQRLRKLMWLTQHKNSTGFTPVKKVKKKKKKKKNKQTSTDGCVCAVNLGPRRVLVSFIFGFRGEGWVSFKGKYLKERDMPTFSWEFVVCVHVRVFGPREWERVGENRSRREKKGWECTREIENRKGEGGVGLGIKQPRSW